MNLETRKSVLLYRQPHQRVNPPGVARCLDPGEADETRAIGCNQPSLFPIGGAIIGMRGRQSDGAVDTRGERPT
jgi:hypothetical protein